MFRVRIHGHDAVYKQNNTRPFVNVYGVILAMTTFSCRARDVIIIIDVELAAQLKCVVADTYYCVVIVMASCIAIFCFVCVHTTHQSFAQLIVRKSAN